ncbi:MAG TPA: opioid growth factor receptor-related protein [Usitatibacteraceae bacterium]|nr:opioid growth factor receptor-related protein [Usitatibacteraceae bacterium]
MNDGRLVSFYGHTGPDHRGRMLRDIRASDISWLEGTHDFIQWLFPIPEPSRVNALAPLLTPADIEAFAANPGMRNELLLSLEVMLRFYGLELSGTPGAPRVERGANYATRSAEWLERPHNFLRISRILRSLTLLGCAPEARAMLECLEGIYAENAQEIGSDTLRYWRRAIEPR